MLESEMTRLFLQKIPHDVSSEELSAVISGDFMLEVKPSKKPGGFYCAVAVFKTRKEADQAFENLEGNLDKDTSGLPQKLVTFKLTSGSEASLYVRKMVQGDSLGEISAKKRTNSDDSDKESKKQKTDGESDAAANQCNGEKSANSEQNAETTSEETIVKESAYEKLLKEIEELKKKLKEKDFQVEAQDKIIGSLKKQLESKKKAPGF